MMTHQECVEELVAQLDSFPHHVVLVDVEHDAKFLMSDVRFDGKHSIIVEIERYDA